MIAFILSNKIGEESPNTRFSQVLNEMNPQKFFDLGRGKTSRQWVTPTGSKIKPKISLESF